MQLQDTQNIHSKPTRKVGFVLKTHGFNGHIRLNINDQSFEPRDFLLVNINDKYVPFKIESLNSEADIVLLEGFNSSDAVQFLINKEILCFSEEEITTEMPDLVGYTLIDLNSRQEFRITSLIEMPQQILIEFRHNYKDCLLPMHEDLITEIDHEKLIVKARFPEGLLDL